MAKAKYHSDIANSLGGETSDHLPRSMVFNFGSGVQLRVATWNQLNKCYSKNPDKADSYSNNPFNRDETPVQYAARKRAQLLELQAMLENNDVIFLQEADWAFPKKSDFKMAEVPAGASPEERARIDQSNLEVIRTNARNGEFNRIQAELEREYVNVLHAAGWDGVKSPEVAFDNDARPRKTTRTKQVVTLYRSGILTPGASAGVLPLPVKDITGRSGAVIRQVTENTGFAVDFTYNNGGGDRPVTLVNMHLDYERSDAEYQRDIEAYARSKGNADIIMAGDTNRPSARIPYLLGNPERASNFDTDRETCTIPSAKHRGTDLTKDYDSFIAVGQNGVVVSEVGGREFSIGRDGAIGVRPYNASRVFNSPHAGICSNDNIAPSPQGNLGGRLPNPPLHIHEPAEKMPRNAGKRKRGADNHQHGSQITSSAPARASSSVNGSPKRSGISKDGLILSGAAFFIGIILLFTPIWPLGLAMMAAGVTYPLLKLCAPSKTSHEPVPSAARNNQLVGEKGKTQEITSQQVGNDNNRSFSNRLAESRRNQDLRSK